MPIQQQSMAKKFVSLSDQQLSRLLSLSKEDRNLQDLHEVVTIISNTGIRACELKQLRWDKVDLHKRHIILCAGKNRELRAIPFGAKTPQVLAGRREREPESDYVLEKNPESLLARVSRQLRTVCDGLGVSGATLHVLRHTFFRRIMDSGAGPQTLRIIDGWCLSFPAIKFSFNCDQLLNIAIRDQARLGKQ